MRHVPREFLHRNWTLDFDQHSFNAPKRELHGFKELEADEADNSSYTLNYERCGLSQSTSPVFACLQGSADQLIQELCAIDTMTQQWKADEANHSNETLNSAGCEPSLRPALLWYFQGAQFADKVLCFRRMLKAV